jgi:hypothetical protein
MLLPEPDINIVCYVVHHPSISTLAAVNAFNERIYARLSLSQPGATPPYTITRTRFQWPTYDGAVDSLLERLGVCGVEEWRESGTEGLVVLRSTVMDPFLVASAPAPDHIVGFIAALRLAAEEVMAGLVS